ncbi:uncharacterized protein AKAW2_50558S [Aspergillus luchuensis]|uniref:Uncharacterized protein n=1 Tax=Aspergillus kawachii TaxID=1069201 RepID=A0A7R7WC35_ASPKA|nr:uncharacterized protein AKAW2_50558S [Aspergillus luchuensis]BCS00217.1 hypothetical protein AKAW2_50558S [Aspergillus luchuensis]
MAAAWALDSAAGKRLTESKNWPSSVDGRPGESSLRSRIASERGSRSGNGGDAQHGHSGVEAEESDGGSAYSDKTLG